MSATRTVMKLISISADYLDKQGCVSSRLDAEVLLAHVLAMNRLQLYLNFDRPLETEEIDAYRQLIGLRARRTPVSYLIGKKEFYSRDFLVNSQVLIPRPETEILVEEALQLAKTISTPRILDLGTGTGIIGITLVLELLEGQIVASDVSKQALEVARENAIQHGVIDQIELVRSDLFGQLAGYTFDIICSNPPYIPTNIIYTLEQEVRQEPLSALDGGEDGLDYYRQILNQARDHLCDRGYLVLEIGWNQADAVKTLGEARGFSWHKTVSDYGGKDRVVVLQWRE